MANDGSQFDSLGEKAQSINIALKYTRGNLDKAKQMVSGEYDDVRIIKGRFSIDSQFKHGAFMLFLNIASNYVMNVNIFVATVKSLFEKTRIFDPWKAFHSNFLESLKQEKEYAVDSYALNKHLSDSIVGYDIFQSVKDGNLDTVSIDIKDILGKFFKADQLVCQIDIEKTSSLAIDVAGIPIDVPPDLSAGKGGESEKMSDTDLDKKMNDIERQAEHIIGGRVIVSPIRGKYINDVRVGDQIKILLSHKDDISLSIAKMLNALDSDEEFLPVKVRVKAKIPLDGGGFIIYGVVAKNILVKIVEEENVKIEMGADPVRVETGRRENTLLPYIVLLIGLILLLFFVIFYFVM